MRQPYVLVVEDDRLFRAMIEDALAPLPVDIGFACSAEEAIEDAERRMPDVVIADHVLPGRTGLDFLLMLGNVKGHPVRILLTAAPKVPAPWGADIPVLQKPVKALVLQQLIREVTQDPGFSYGATS